MPYRINTLDIIVGVGMTAIVFGAMLLLVATAGTFQPGAPAAAEGFPEDSTGMIWLQPALGQAVVEQALLEQQAKQSLAASVSEWNRATLASYDFQSRPGGPFGFVMMTAAVGPAEHAARVQGVMGRSIVNFTRRGIRSEVLSANQLLSSFNDDMIRRTQAMGLRMEQSFEAMWQPTLGRAIVESFQQYVAQAGAIQERMGAAVLHLTHAQAITDTARAANQHQLATLVAAAIRTNALSDRLQLLAAIDFPQEPAAASTQPASWPEIPMSFVIMAMLAMSMVFFAGVILSAMSRAAKAQAEMTRDASRWVYRMAS